MVSLFIFIAKLQMRYYLFSYVEVFCDCSVKCRSVLITCSWRQGQDRFCLSQAQWAIFSSVESIQSRNINSAHFVINIFVGAAVVVYSPCGLAEGMRFLFIQIVSRKPWTGFVLCLWGLIRADSRWKY